MYIPVARGSVAEPEPVEPVCLEWSRSRQFLSEVGAGLSRVKLEPAFLSGVGAKI